MRPAALRYLTLIALLTMGVLATRLTAPPVDLPPDPATAADAQVYTVDLDTWRATDRQRTLASPYDFRLGPGLLSLPLELGPWRGRDVPELNNEVFRYLQPEQYVKRLYELEGDPAGRYLWLFLIGSRRLGSFHAPDICYSAIEWQTDVTSRRVALPSGDLYAMRILAANDRERQMSLYFFVYPDLSRDPALGIVMLRVASPVWDTESATMTLQEDFLRRLFR